MEESGVSYTGIRGMKEYMYNTERYGIHIIYMYVRSIYRYVCSVLKYKSTHIGGISTYIVSDVYIVYKVHMHAYR